ncbi:Twinfilin-1 [Dispira parvispora]|uniref:Twinfilin-1 n=1 Tax=Dispira parvispora TaxID=1520584 RepID=A0A9W8ARG9_9FUNG|nr:Twinfilin-1 [Dispira parvispora]
MSSLNSGVKVSSTLQRLFNDLKDGREDSVLVLKIEVKDGELVLAEKKNGPLTAGVRYSPIEDMVSELHPAYFMIRREPQKWCLVSWVPEGGRVSVRDKMIYASSQSCLKFAFGFGQFVDTVHLSTMNDIRPRFHKAPKEVFSPREVMSNQELMKLEAIQMEQKARTERLDRLNEPRADHATQKQTSAALSGGFHTVQLPFTDQAADAISTFFGGNTGPNVIELKITEDKTSVDLAATQEESDVGNSFPVTTHEPRFYAIRFPDGPFVHETILVYLCPDNSPPKWRMVYSTALGGVLDECKQRGFNFGYKLSVFHPKDCTFPQLIEKIRNKSAHSLSRTRSVHDIINYTNNQNDNEDPTTRVGRYIYTRPSPTSSPSQSHPVYGLMASAVANRSTSIASPGGNSSPLGVRKKIVIPPPGAY